VAHEAAVAHGGGTVAVLGCGIDVVYPREHAPLFEKIASAGLLLSEFLPGDPPLAFNFPRRNRIIGRMPHGLLVVEAREDSGALITAEIASETMPVMAVPGPIGRPTSHGPNRLIQDGAKLVMEVRDVVEELGGALNAAAARGRPSARRRWHKPGRPAGSTQRAGQAQESLELPAGPEPPLHARVRGAVGAVGRHIDALARSAGLDAATVLTVLLELELAGAVQSLGGKRYRLPPPGPARPQPHPQGGVYPA
jgi:predicted Rossmann fold nucleotide-binding protein DprA/Smf involved in DNA uptake